MNERLKQLRKCLGLNQTEFGARIKIKQTTIAGYENGSRAPRDAIIAAICNEYSVSEQWLRTGDGEMFVQRTREEELGDFIADVLKDEPDSFRRRIVAILAKLTPSDWAAIEKRGREILDELEEEKKKPAP